MTEKLKTFRTVDESGTNLAKLEKTQPSEEKEADPIPYIGESGVRQVVGYSQSFVSRTFGVTEKSISLRNDESSAKSDIRSISVDSLETMGEFSELGPHVYQSSGTETIRIAEFPDVTEDNYTIMLNSTRSSIKMELPLSQTGIRSVRYIPEGIVIETTHRNQYYKGLELELAGEITIPVVVFSVIDMFNFLIKRPEDRNIKNYNFEFVLLEYPVDIQKRCHMLNELISIQAPDSKLSVYPFGKDHVIIADGVSDVQRTEPVPKIFSKLEPNIVEVHMNRVGRNFKEMMRELNRALSDISVERHCSFTLEMGFGISKVGFAGTVNKGTGEFEIPRGKYTVSKFLEILNGFEENILFKYDTNQGLFSVESKTKTPFTIVCSDTLREIIHFHRVMKGKNTYTSLIPIFYKKPTLNNYSLAHETIGRATERSVIRATPGQARKFPVRFKLSGHIFRLLQFRQDEKEMAYYSSTRNEELANLGSKIYVALEGVENPYTFTSNSPDVGNFKYFGEMERRGNSLVLREPSNDLRVLPSTTDIRFVFYAHTGIKISDTDVEKIVRLRFSLE